MVVALAVLVRWSKHRRSWLELLYAAAWLSFAASDFYEAQRLTGWLILAKGVNLLTLILLRQRILTRYYPKNHTF